MTDPSPPKAPSTPAKGAVITSLLLEWSHGDEQALQKLVPLVYDELKRLAAASLRREKPGHTLQPTAVVHETYLKLVDQRRVEWKSRAHFFAVAAQAMRRLLVDHARARLADKRGGGATRIALDENLAAKGSPNGEVDLLALDEAMDRLGALDEKQARVVELRYFGGLTIEETAAVLGSSPATVKRDWQSAKAWLFRELSGA